jgi:hypothetical protein
MASATKIIIPLLAIILFRSAISIENIKLGEIPGTGTDTNAVHKWETWDSTLNVTGTGNEYYSTDVSTYPVLSVGDRNKFQNDFPAIYAMGIRPTVYVDSPGILQAGIGGVSTGPFSFGMFGLCNNSYGTALTGAAYGQPCVGVSADSCSYTGGCSNGFPAIRSNGDLAIKNCEGCTAYDGQICFGGDSCSSSYTRIKYDNDGDYGYGASAFFFSTGLIPTANESYPLGYNDNMWYSSHISHMYTKDITPVNGELQIVGNLTLNGNQAVLGQGTTIGDSLRNVTFQPLDLGAFGTYEEMIPQSDGPLGNVGGVKNAFVIEGDTPTLMFLKVGVGSGIMGWDAGTNGFYFDSAVAMHNGYSTHYQDGHSETQLAESWDGSTSTFTITGEPVHTNNNLTAEGYIQSNAGFIGDGSQLTNLPAPNLTDYVPYVDADKDIYLGDRILNVSTINTNSSQILHIQFPNDIYNNTYPLEIKKYATFDIALTTNNHLSLRPSGDLRLNPGNYLTIAPAFSTTVESTMNFYKSTGSIDARWFDSSGQSILMARSSLSEGEIYTAGTYSSTALVFTPSNYTTGYIKFNTGYATPYFANASDLGSASLYWKNVYSGQYYGKNDTIIAFDDYKDSDLIKGITQSFDKKFVLPNEVVDTFVENITMKEDGKIINKLVTTESINLGKLHGLELGALKELINRTEYLESENKALKEQLTNICKMNGLKGCNT